MEATPKKWRWSADGSWGLTTAPTKELALERLRKVILKVDVLPADTRIFEIDPNEPITFKL